MFCPKCGSQLKDGAKFCTKCGAKIEPEGSFTSQTEIVLKPEPKENVSEKQKSTPKKKKKKSLVPFLLLLLFLLLAAGGGVFYYTKMKKATDAERVLSELLEEDDDIQETREVQENEEEPETRAERPAETAAETEAPYVETEAAREESLTAQFAYAQDVNFSGYRKISVQRENTTQSSHIVQKNAANDNTAWSAFDGDPKTSWQEGVDGDGIGESIYASFGRNAQVRVITLMLGNHRTDDWYVKNNRPKTLSIVLGGQRFVMDFPDQKQEFAVVFSAPVSSGDISVFIDDVYQGTQYDDTIIAEIGVYEE